MRATNRLIAEIVLICCLAALHADVARGEGASLDVAVVQIAEQVAPAIRERRMSIAVPDLTMLDGQPCVLGRYIAEDLVTALFGLGATVVERRLLDRAFTELELGLTDLMNPDEAKRFGRLVGAEGMLVGTLTDLGRVVKVNARVVEVETGHVVGAAAAVLEKDEQLGRMLRQPVVMRPPVRLVPRKPPATMPLSAPAEPDPIDRLPPTGERGSGLYMYRDSRGVAYFSRGAR